MFLLITINSGPSSYFFFLHPCLIFTSFGIYEGKTFYTAELGKGSQVYWVLRGRGRLVSELKPHDSNQPGGSWKGELLDVAYGYHRLLGKGGVGRLPAMAERAGVQ